MAAGWMEEESERPTKGRDGWMDGWIVGWIVGWFLKINPWLRKAKKNYYVVVDTVFLAGISPH